MISQQVDPKKVLYQKFDKEDFGFYLRVFLPFFIFMLAAPIVFAIRILIRGDYDLKSVVSKSLMMLAINFVILACSVVFMIIFSTITKKRYNKQVDKYGYETLATQLAQPYNAVTYIHPEKYESYVIVTGEFFILARTKIIRLNEIRQMRFERTTRGNASRPFNISNKSPNEITRFIRQVHIIDAEGKDASYPVALPEFEYYDLVNYMATILGPNMVYLV